MGNHSSAFVQICAERLIVTVVLTVVGDAKGSFDQIAQNIEGISIFEGKIFFLIFTESPWS